MSVTKSTNLRELLKTPRSSFDEEQSTPEPDYQEKMSLALSSISWQLKRIADKLEGLDD